MGEQPRKRRPSAFGVTVLMLVLAVVAAAGAVAWQLVVTPSLARPRQDAAVANFNQACAAAQPTAGTTKPAEGTPIALLTLPSLGVADLPVLAGTGRASLGSGVGWYPDSALPGQVGNFAVAGYSVTNSAPFEELLLLGKGDQVLVRTCGTTYIYEIDVAPRELTVSADDGWVLDAVPGQPGRLAATALITLTTSQDKLPTGDLAVGFGHLVRQTAAR